MGEEASFIASKTFIGTKPGFYFSKGPQGLGYYTDSVQTLIANNDLKKRKREENHGENKAQKYHNNAVTVDNGVDEVEDHDEDDVDAILKKADEIPITQLDAASLKTMLFNFEKKINKNQKMRMKYPDEPEKFMESEIELNEQIQELYTIAAYPELFKDIIHCNGITSILGVITHENTDISISIIGLLQEMLEADTIQEVDDAIIFVDSFIENQGIELIVQNLMRLNEENEEDAEGVHNTLSIVENLINIQPANANKLCTNTQILNYLLSRLRVKEMSPNKLYVSEILSMLIQSNTSNRLLFLNLILNIPECEESSNSMDVLLQLLAPYRKRHIEDADEQEMVYNIFLSLCSLMLESECQEKFIELEGLELMTRFMKERTATAGRAYKAVSYAVTKNRQACVRFIQADGLKYVFSVLMGKGLPKGLEKKKPTHPDRCELETQAITIICQLCVNMYGSFAQGDVEYIPQQRLLSKFIENDHEKALKLIELYQKYNSKLEQAEKDIELILKNDPDEFDDDDILAQRMDAGLMTVQEVATILAFVSLITTATLELVDSNLVKNQLNSLHVAEMIEEHVVLLESNAKEMEGKQQKVETDNIDRLGAIQRAMIASLVECGKVEKDEES